jgi:hypothetical protein
VALEVTAEAGTGAGTVGGECGVVGNWYVRQPKSLFPQRDCFTQLVN